MILGSLLSEPEPDDVLKSFYKTVRPWGFWGRSRRRCRRRTRPSSPTADSAGTRSRRPGHHLADDARDHAAHMVLKYWKGMWIPIILFVVLSWILKKTWKDHIED